jgi:hypothetical protein
LGLSTVVATPYALLLAIPGLNVVTIADRAGEGGPIAFYRLHYEQAGCASKRAVFAEFTP